VVHVADFPSAGHEERLVHFVDEMGVVKPDLVLASGDLAYDGSGSWYRFLEAQFARLEAMGIRVVPVAGNHEWGGRTQWLRHFGTRTASRVDFGPLAILSLDSAHGRDRFTPSQFRWIRTQLDHLDGRTAIIQLHHPVFPPGLARFGDGDGSGGYLRCFQGPFVALCESRGVAAVLSGHWHQDAVFDGEGRLRDDRSDFPGTRFIVTTSLGDSARRVTRWPERRFGYRILDFEDGRLVRYTFDEAGDGRRPIAGVPAGTYLPGAPQVRTLAPSLAAPSGAPSAPGAQVPAPGAQVPAPGAQVPASLPGAR
jgi:3',5'-cyclic AMP phosphodiesterase CpdA